MWGQLATRWRDARPLVRAVRIGIAAIWLAFGLAFKVAGLVPRHEAIAGRVVGNDVAAWLIAVIGLAEAAVGLWFLSGLWPRTCMALMTAAIIAMNLLELWMAFDLLLAPWPMVVGNVLMLAAGWWAATRPPR